MHMPSSVRRCAVSIFLLSAACTYPKVWVEQEERFDAATSGVARVECRTENGAIALDAIPAASPACGVQVRKRAGASDEAGAREALAAIRLVRSENSGTLTLGWEWSEPKREEWGASVSFALTIPEDRATSLVTSNGEVRVHGLKAAVHVTTSNGAIRLEECDGDWEALTSNGSIVASGSPDNLALRTSNGAVEAQVKTPGPVSGKVRTSNGRIDVSLAESSSTRVKAETSNGSVKAEGAWRVFENGKSSLEASRNGGNGMLLLDANNGSITVRCAAGGRP